MEKQESRVNRFWSIAMTIVCVLWMYPIFMVLMISLKARDGHQHLHGLPTCLRPKPLRAWPTMRTPSARQGFLSSLFYSVFITVTSVFAILIFCSMFAWYITRVRNALH